MTKELTSPNFDYSLVTTDDAAKLRYCAGQLSSATKRHSELIVETGEMLAQAQDVLANYSGGVFQSWIAAECVYSKTTAYRFIDCHAQFGSCPNLGQLEPSAMYILTSNKKLSL